MQERLCDEIPFVKIVKHTGIFADLKKGKKLGAEAANEGKTRETLKKSLVFLVFKMTPKRQCLPNEVLTVSMSLDVLIGPLSS